MIKYNDEQLNIINAKCDKNILVSAAAGSGKTTVLTERIVSLLDNTIEGSENIKLSDILVMTFTKKATYEMKSRIKTEASPNDQSSR